MAQFKPFAENVQVNGATVSTTVNVFPSFMQSIGIRILEDNGISNPKIDGWYCQAAWLNAFKEISLKFGPHTLYEMGKAIPNHATFPNEIDSLEKALSSIDVAYQMNHRNGEIGFYKLENHDMQKKTMTMHCRNPYPCDFDRGIITAMARKFKPSAAVILDLNKPSRKIGADDSWYVVKY